MNETTTQKKSRVYKVIIEILIVIIFAILIIFLWINLRSPKVYVPPEIYKKLNYKLIYPEGLKIEPGSWKYTTSQGSVTFEADAKDFKVIFNEQQVPLAFKDDAAAYNRFVGGLRPIANFNAPLGSVSLTQFVTADKFQTVGVTAVVNTHGTLILAHPDTNLTDSQWRSLCNSLKVY